MTVIDKLATSLNKRDEGPNIELAKQIAAAKDKAAVKELADHLHDKNKNIQQDCIKTLYEIGALQPSLIAPYYSIFLSLLSSKNNRMQWGAMTALSSIAAKKTMELTRDITVLEKTANEGSVISKDGFMAILIKLIGHTKISDGLFKTFIKHLQTAAVNQLPMYAENALPIINEKNKTIFIETLQSRLKDIEKESKRKRVEKIIRKLSK